MQRTDESLELLVDDVEAAGVPIQARNRNCWATTFRGWVMAT